MVMHFGPVNKKGGEKRLNVLFSRARKHMAVISSIRYDQITNEYNTGASYLRRFLQYAEDVSGGRMAAARSILDGLTDRKTKHGSAAGSALTCRQLKDRLCAMGYEVEGPVGQSDFKCSLAVKKKGEDGDYALAILIDDEEHYRNANRMEQYYLRPAILRRFGWNVLPVYAKDWLHQPQKIMERILKILGHPPIARTPSVDAVDPDLSFHRLVHPVNDMFWEAAVDGNRLVLHWGRNGTRGQTRLRTFADEGSAKQELERLENEQRENGYHEPR